MLGQTLFFLKKTTCIIFTFFFMEEKQLYGHALEVDVGQVEISANLKSSTKVTTKKGVDFQGLNSEALASPGPSALDHSLPPYFDNILEPIQTITVGEFDNSQMTSYLEKKEVSFVKQ